MIALEHIQPGDWAAVNRVIDQLRSVVPDTGGTSLNVRAGSVAATGAIISGSGFTVTKNATGDYTVTLAFARAPVVVVGTGESAAAYAVKLHSTTPPSATGFRVATFLTATGAAVDGAFHWWAIG